VLGSCSLCKPVSLGSNESVTEPRTLAKLDVKWNQEGGFQPLSVHNSTLRFSSHATQDAYRL
jgi:hypothetical protein